VAIREKVMRLSKGYVATLDVLGFADLLYRDGYSEQLKLYLATVNDVIRPSHVKVDCVVFSDSIVLTSSGETRRSFIGLIKACSEALYELLLCGMPVRGAVSFGSYWREATSDSVFLAGRPIVEAYNFERAQKWIGIILCPSVLHKQDNLVMATYLPDSRDSDNSKDELAIRLQPAVVPFQQPGAPAIGTLNAYAVVPLETPDTFATAHRSVSRVIPYLHDLRLKAPTPASQEKYTASIAWLSEIEERYEQTRLARMGRAPRAA
jgi:hypothetical protein